MSHRTTITGWKRTALAVTLAYALALQGLLLALGGAMHVQAAGLPETVLCLQDDTGGAPHQPGQSNHALCCILGCSTSAAPGGPIPVAVSLKARQPALVDIALVAQHRVLAASSNVLPVGSRAPPRLG